MLNNEFLRSRAISPPEEAVERPAREEKQDPPTPHALATAPGRDPFEVGTLRVIINPFAYNALKEGEERDDRGQILLPAEEDSCE